MRPTFTAVVTLLACSCSWSPSASRQPTDALDQALTSTTLGIALNWRAAPDLKAPSVPTAFAPEGSANRTANVRFDLTSAAVTVEAVAGGDSLTFRPLNEPEQLRARAPGRVVKNTALFLAHEGDSAIVETAELNGVKESLVLTKPSADSLRQSWVIDFKGELEARLEASGAVGVYGLSGVLSGPIQTADAASALALAKAREHAKRDVLRFRIPAPTVTTGSGRRVDHLAHFELGAAQGSRVELTLVAEGLGQLEYPLNLDPSVVVTNAADFELGGNLEGNIDVTATSIKRALVSSGVGTWATTTSLPAARFGHASVASNGFLYVLGGNGDRADVQVAPINADGTVGTFSAISSFSTGRSALCAAIANGNLYVVGGFHQATNTALADVQVAPIRLNGTLGPFRATTSFATGRSAHGCVAYNNALYVLGGTSATGTLFNDVQVAPLLATGDVGSFVSTSAFVTARSGLAAAAFNGVLYLAGGSNGAALGDVQMAVVDPTGKLGAFSVTSTLIQPRAFHGLAIAQGTMFVTGNGTETQFAPIYRGGSVGPFGLASPFATARDSHATVAYQGHLYVVGGQNSGTPLSDVQVAPLAFQGPMSAPWVTNTFGSGTMFQRYSHCAAAANGYLYITGGAFGGSYFNDILYAPIAADGTIGGFTSAPVTFATPRSDHGCFVYQGYLYIVGGRVGASTYAGDVQSAPLNANGSPGAFTATNSLPTGVLRGGMGVGVHVNVGVNAYVYVAGGFDGTTRRAEVYKAAINSGGTVGTWAATTSLPSGRSGQSATVFNGVLYVTGGIDSGNTFLNEVLQSTIDVNNGNVGAFTPTSSFAVGRSGHETVAFNDWLYIIGGNGASGMRNDVQAAPILGGGSLGTFSQVGTLPVYLYEPSSVVNDGFLYVTGGQTSNSTYSNSVYLSTLAGAGTVGPMSDTSAAVTASTSHADLIANNGFLYVVGGLVTSAAQNSVRFAAINSNGTLGPLVATTSFTGARFTAAAVIANNVLYVIGGFNGAALSDIQYAHLNADGTVGAFTATTPLPVARSGVAAAAYNGRLFVVGGNNVNVSTGDIVSAPINADGSLGAFTTTTAVVAPRASHGVVIYNGNLYVIGGYASPAAVNLHDIELVPIAANGSLGTATLAGTMPSVSQVYHAVGVGDGYLYTAGGGSSLINSAPFNANGTLGTFSQKSSLSETLPAGNTATVANGFLYVLGGSHLAVQVGKLRTPAARGVYSKLVDLQNQSNALSLVVNGTTSVGTTSLEYRTAPVSGVFSATTVSGPIANGVAVGLAGSNQRYAWFKLTLDDTFATPGVNLPTTNARDVTDVTVSSTSIPLALTPATITLAPLQATTFTASGGSGVGLTWALTTNGSGGSVVNGTYTAGSTGGKTDVVQVTDSLGNTATGTVTVTASLQAMPATPSISPRGSIAFSASGGSNTGFTWAAVSTPSGGSITGAGAYTAGSTGSVTDVIKVTDSLGAVAQVNITVTAGLKISPTAPSVAPSGTVAFSASGGSGTGLTWALTQKQSGAATIDGTGSYHAGSGQGTDIVQVTDSLGNSATMSVTVTNSLAITPNAVTVPPRGAQLFKASGGSGSGFTFTFVTNNSGASLAIDGAYAAGPTPAVQDTIRVTDSLSNTALSVVTVGPGLSPKATPASVPPLGAAVLSTTGGSGVGVTFTFITNASGGTITGANYVAGPVGGVVDRVQVVDSLGNSAAFDLAVGASISISPATATVAPRTSQPFTATGGSGLGYTWSLLANNSMGSIGAGTGLYVAGRIGTVVDTVQVTDSLGNVASRQVSVTDAISITPSTPAVPPHGSLLLTASGGTGAGYTWLFLTNRSGATVSANSGLYQAGGTADVIDVVQVVDSIGNTGTVNITVGAPLAIAPLSPTVTPKQTITFAAVGGAGQNRWSLSANGSGGSIDTSTGVYVAGAVGNTSDTVTLTDMLNNVATTVVTVTGALSLTPVTASVAPLAAQQFTAVGGSDAGYTFSVTTNRSGGSIDSTGAYRAGAVPNVSDTITVSDGLATATAVVSVGDGVTITPGTATVNVTQKQAFTASGGSGQGYQWVLSTNGSGGSIDASSGSYQAGSAGNTTDEVTVTDSLGNVGTARITVVGTGGQSTIPPSERNPINGFSCGCQSGNGGAFTALLGLVFLLRTRRRSSLLLAASVAVTLLSSSVSFAAEAKKKGKAPAASKKPVEPAPPPAPAPAPPPVIEPPPAPVRPAVPAKPSMAVLDVEVSTTELKLDARAFTDIVVTAIEATTAFKVISSEDIKTVLGVERQRQLMGCSDDTACTAELANALGSEFLFTGNVGRVGDTFVVTAKMLYAPRSMVVGRASVQTKSANALLESMWRAATETLDAYGASLPPVQAAEWAARPKPKPPATVVAAEPSTSLFGAVVSGVFGYQPLSVVGKRGSIGGQVDFSWRKERFEVLLGVVVAASPGGRVTGLFALVDSRFRLDVGLQVALFPGLGPTFGGGPTVGAEFAITPHWFVQARGAFEAYPTQGTVILAVLGGAGVAARF